MNSIVIAASMILVVVGWTPKYDMSPTSFLSKRLFSYVLLMLAVYVRAAASQLSCSMLYRQTQPEAYAP